MALSGSQVTYPSFYGGPGAGYGNFGLKSPFVPQGAAIGVLHRFEWLWDRWLYLIPIVTFPW